MSTTGLPITQGSGQSSVATELVGGNSFQQVEIYGGGGASVLTVNPDGSFKASIIGTPTVLVSGTPSISGAVTIVGSSIPNGSVSGTIGASIIGLVPVSVTAPLPASSVSAILAPYSASVQGITSVMTGTTSVLVLGAPSGTQRNYITHILVTNAAVVGTTVTIQDGASILWGGWAAAGGGWSENFNPPLPQPTSVKALYATSSIQASVFVGINGFTGT